jgi:hypothetical protein
MAEVAAKCVEKLCGEKPACCGGMHAAFRVVSCVLSFFLLYFSSCGAIFL